MSWGLTMGQEWVIGGKMALMSLLPAGGGGGTCCLLAAGHRAWEEHTDTLSTQKAVIRLWLVRHLARSLFRGGGAGQQWGRALVGGWLRRHWLSSGRMVCHVVGRLLQSFQEELFILQEVVVL